VLAGKKSITVISMDEREREREKERETLEKSSVGEKKRGENQIPCVHQRSKKNCKY